MLRPSSCAAVTAPRWAYQVVPQRPLRAGLIKLRRSDGSALGPSSCEAAIVSRWTHQVVPLSHAPTATETPDLILTQHRQECYLIR